MADKKYILAIDHGTSGIKNAIVSTSGEIADFKVQEYQVYYPEQGAAEQSPLEWWDALVKTTHQLLEHSHVPVEDIVAVTTCNQMSGTIPIDKDGNLLHNCITWLDTRGADVIKKLCGGPINISGYGITNLLRWTKRTGGAPGLSGKDIIGHILWLKKAHPEIYSKTWKFLDCKDYIIYRLTGQVATSNDCAIITWLLNDQDPQNMFYDPALLKKAKIDKDKLPDPHPATHIVGTLLPGVAKELGLKLDTKVVLGAGDIAAAAVGSGAVLDEQAHICVGSSSWVVAHIPKRKLDVFHMIASLPSAIPGRYIFLGEQESAGINLVWLRDKVLYHKDELLMEEKVPNVYKIFDQIVETIEPGAHNLIFTPWMFGERAPVEDHTIRGGLYNVSLDIDRRHIVRAIFEGIAFNTRWLLMYLEKKLKRELTPINIIGGGAASDVWCQIYADILNRNIRQHKTPKEGNSIGATYIASVALGYLNWEQIPTLFQLNKEYTPRSQYREIYNKLFKEFVNIYKNNKAMFRRLNQFHH